MTRVGIGEFDLMALCDRVLVRFQKTAPFEAVSKPVLVASSRHETSTKQGGGKMPPLRQVVLKLVLTLTGRLAL